MNTNLRQNREVEGRLDVGDFMNDGEANNEERANQHAADPGRELDSRAWVDPDIIDPFAVAGESEPAGAQPLGEDGLPMPKPKRTWKGFSYKDEKLIDDPNGLRRLFQVFTMQPETIGNLKGGSHQASDLKRIIGVFRAWHLVHCPKLEYYYFLEKVQQFGKQKDVAVYMQKMRNHHKGVEILEEFQHVFGGETGDQTAGAGSTEGGGAFGRVFGSPSKPSGTAGVQPASTGIDSGRKLRFQLDDPLTQDHLDRNVHQQQHLAGHSNVANEPNQQINSWSTPGSHRNQQQPELTPEQLQRIEENRQKALRKKRQRQEMEAATKQAYDEQDDLINDFEALMEPAAKRASRKKTAAGVGAPAIDDDEDDKLVDLLMQDEGLQSILREEGKQEAHIEVSDDDIDLNEIEGLDELIGDENPMQFNQAMAGEDDEYQ